MPRLKAQKKLELVDSDDDAFRAISPDGLYDLVMAATGNEDLANQYRVMRARADWKQRT